MRITSAIKLQITYEITCFTELDFMSQITIGSSEALAAMCTIISGINYTPVTLRVLINDFISLYDCMFSLSEAAVCKHNQMVMLD